jgi:hypothetical protein
MTNKKKTAEPEIVLTQDQIDRYTKEIEDYKKTKKGKLALKATQKV